jgi:hypothetical protein
MSNVGLLLQLLANDKVAAEAKSFLTNTVLPKTKAAWEEASNFSAQQEQDIKKQTEAEPTAYQHFGFNVGDKVVFVGNQPLSYGVVTGSTNSEGYPFIEVVKEDGTKDSFIAYLTLLDKDATALHLHDEYFFDE